METQSLSIEGTIALTESDVTQAQVERASRSPLMTAGIFGGVMVLQAARRAGAEAAVVSLIVMGLGGLVLVHQVPRIIARRLYRRLVNFGENLWSYRFDDDGVTIRGPNMVVGFSYSHMSHVREVKNSLQIRTIFSSDLWIVPKPGVLRRRSVADPRAVKNHCWDPLRN